MHPLHKQYLMKLTDPMSPILASFRSSKCEVLRNHQVRKPSYQIPRENNS